MVWDILGVTGAPALGAANALASIRSLLPHLRLRKIKPACECFVCTASKLTCCHQGLCTRTQPVDAAQVPGPCRRPLCVCCRIRAPITILTVIIDIALVPRPN
jgi:hypothetical protein